MLCIAPSVQVRSALFLENAQEYHYLNQSGCVSVDGMDDVREFEDVESALKKLDFGEDEKMDMYKVAAAVLHVGNIKFDPQGSDACKLNDKSSVTKVATLLGVPEAGLCKTLVRREITLRGETVAVDLNVEKAVAGRDALAKSLYGKLFDWLVVRTNKALVGKSVGPGANFIGILDIFGFEIFKSNSFEQLCINFCNEKLQQHFNRNTFVLEEDTYKSEGIQFDHIEYIDNQDVLNLIEKKPKGILVILDDEVSVPRGSDRGFYNKICKVHKGNPRFLQPRMAQSQFVVNHYAGGVKYTIDDMVEKNKDRLEEDMATLMTNATLPFVSSGLYGSMKKAMEQKKKGGNARGSRYVRTQSAVFRASLQQLMKRLNATDPHYIRCIKTNAVKKPGIFTAPMCLEQLRYAGVFEAVSIRKQGYPFRFTHEDFYKRFRCITKPKLPKLTSGFKEGCKSLLKQTAQRPMAAIVKNCKIGQTMVLYRSKESAALELLRAIVAEAMAKKIQGVFRGLRARNLVTELKKHVPPLRDAVKSRSEADLRSAIDAASSIWFEIKLLKEARAMLKGLEREKEMTLEISTLVTMDPDLNYDKYEKMIVEMAGIMRNDPGAFQDDNSKKLRKAFKSVEDRRECQADLKDGCARWNSAQLKDALTRLAKLKTEWGDFCPGLESEAKDILGKVDAEKALALKIKSLVDTGTVRGTPGRLSGDNISTKELRSFIAQAREGVRTPMLKKAVRLGAVLCSLRESVKEALQNDGPTTGDLWARVREALVAATQEMGESGKANPELNLIQEDAAARAKIEEIAEKIRFATENLDEEWLMFGIDQAVRLNMDSHQSPSIRQAVSDARKTLRMISETKELLQEGIDQVSMDKMESGLALASKFKFETDVVSEARDLYTRCVELKNQAETAHRRVVVELMRQSIESCTRERLKLKVLDKMRALIVLPEPKLLQRQLKASVLLGEHDRVTSLTVRIKELFFDQAGGMFSFAKYPNLKPRNLFAKRYGVHNEHLKRNMLCWTNEPLHTSLTRLDGPGISPVAKKHATRVFKNILGYMGDRQYSYPILLAQEVTRCGLECPSVRDEIYCQIVKQLIDNPGKSSVARGWNLMALCLSTFPPSDEFENFLELFLRTNHQDRSVHKLHKIVYRGARTAPIPVEEIEEIQHRGSRFSIVGGPGMLSQMAASR
jgi:myosin heavy subunit